MYTTASGKCGLRGHGGEAWGLLSAPRGGTSPSAQGRPLCSRGPRGSEGPAAWGCPSTPLPCGAGWLVVCLSRGQLILSWGTTIKKARWVWSRLLTQGASKSRHNLEWERSTACQIFNLSVTGSPGSTSAPPTPSHPRQQDLCCREVMVGWVGLARGSLGCWLPSARNRLGPLAKVLAALGQGGAAAFPTSSPSQSSSGRRLLPVPQVAIKDKQEGIE